MEKLDPNTRLVRNPNLVSTDMDGDTVMMNIDHGAYYGLKGVASRSWDLLETPVTLTELCATLCTEYEVDEITCLSEVSVFITQLLDYELVQCC